MPPICGAWWRMCARWCRGRCHRMARLPTQQARPHGLRHAAITAGFDRTGGDTRAVQAFARLRDANTIRHYDDSRADLGGAVAGHVADGVGI